jgi:hypothetical protein
MFLAFISRTILGGEYRPGLIAQSEMAMKMGGKKIQLRVKYRLFVKCAEVASSERGLEFFLLLPEYDSTVPWNRQQTPSKSYPSFMFIRFL